MLLHAIEDEKDFRDGRIYLCCRSSRNGNAIWETLEAQKHRLIYGEDGLCLPIGAFTWVFDLPKRVADIEQIK